MRTRKIGPFSVGRIAYGTMNLTHAYTGLPDRATAYKVLNQAVDLGDAMIDTAPIYGKGLSESYVGEALKTRRGEYMLATKGALSNDDQGKRVIDARPETVLRMLDESLRRLQTDAIDLYYIHRPDPQVPIEETIGALAGAVKAGKIRSIGLSEMSADQLRRAHAVHPIAAMQTEYSLWTRNPEIAVLDACREVGAAFVAFSPLARGYLTDVPPQPETFAPGDLRRGMPRFQGENYRRNLALLPQLDEVAAEAGCTRAQAALAWLLQKAEHIVALPGTGDPRHLAENAGADDVTLGAQAVERLERIFAREAIHGARYNPATQQDVTTEEFAS